MALRIADVIDHGWIDNTSPGVTTGELYLLGVTNPVKIYLKGNCWRDIAGAKLKFNNPNPVLDEKTCSDIHLLQKGVIGDITGSIKMKIPTISTDQFEEYFAAGKEIPFEWKNSIYLEWFSMANGRIVIESSIFETSLTEPAWQLSREEENLQRIENTHMMNQFMHLTLGMVDTETDIDFETDEADEFEWEKRLKLRDQLEEAAWLMESDAQTGEDTIPDIVAMESRHPLVQFAFKVHEDITKRLGESILDDGPRGGLANAVGYIFESTDDAWPQGNLHVEKGYQLAVLKRSVEACNHAVAYCNTIILEDESYDNTRFLMHELRSRILDSLKDLRST